MRRSVALERAQARPVLIHETSETLKGNSHEIHNIYSLTTAIFSVLGRRHVN